MTTAVSTAWPVQEFDLDPNRFVSLREFAGPSHAIRVSIAAGAPVDVFFVDDPNFTLFKIGKPFEYFGRFGVRRMNQSFQPPTYRDWHLVIVNPGHTPVRVVVSAAATAMWSLQ